MIHKLWSPFVHRLYCIVEELLPMIHKLWSPFVHRLYCIVEELLPMIHKLWSPFVHRLSDEEPFVIIQVSYTMSP